MKTGGSLCRQEECGFGEPGRAASTYITIVTPTWVLYCVLRAERAQGFWITTTLWLRAVHCNTPQCVTSQRCKLIFQGLLRSLSGVFLSESHSPCLLLEQLVVGVSWAQRWKFWLTSLLLLRTWDGEFFSHQVHWCVSAEGSKGRQLSLILLGVDVSKESDMLLGVYVNIEKHLGEFWESGYGFPKVYILRFRSQLWMTQGTKVVGVLWVSGVKKMQNGNSGGKGERTGDRML